jgi:hypothetical protein
MRRWSAVAALAVLAAALVALMVITRPALRESARHHDCVQNLKQIGLGLIQYQSSRGSFPYAALPDASLQLEERNSWIISVVPFMLCFHCWGLDEFAKIDFAASLDAGARSRLAVFPLGLVLCPSSPFRPAHGTHAIDHYVDRSRLSDPVPLTYVGLTGVGKDAASLPRGDPRVGVFGFDRATRPEDVSDGMSATLMVVETSDLRGVWVAGGEATVRCVDPATRPYLGRGRPFGGNHSGRTLALFADGSVRDIRDTIAPEMFEALSTIAGGERLPSDWENKWVVRP